MRLLLVAATEQEITPLLSAMKFCGDISPQLRWYQFKGHNIDVLVTGVGMVATAAWVSRTLATRNYSSALNAGICGSFDREIALGEVVRVQTEFMPELGAEDGDKFISVYNLQLAGENDFPFQNGLLNGSDATAFRSLSKLKPVTGITVNKVHGSEHSIAEVVKRNHPQVESMEGAAFFYACLTAGISHIQVRAVSNYVERRNRDAWKIAEAVKNLNAELLNFFEQQ